MITMTPRWAVVIFDIDGTLVDTVDLIVASYQHAFRTVLGHEWDETEIRTWIGQAFEESLQRVCPDHIDELFRVYIEWNHAHTEEMLKEYPGIRELVTELAAAGVRLGAATSKRHVIAQRALDLGNLGDIVPLLASHEDSIEHKPNPAPLLVAAAKVSCPPSEAVYVGDAVVDILAATNAGMDSIAVTWGAGIRAELVDAGPTVVVDTVDELRAVLFGAC